jgi:hypothetical protein
MDLDTVLTDTFAAHEHLAPPEDAVRAAVRRRVGRQSVALGRPLGIAASVAVILGVAGATVAVGNSRHPGAGHAATNHGRPALASVSAAAPHPVARIAALTMPYDLGWLPDGTVSYLARRVQVGGTSQTSAPVFDGEYLLSVRSPDRTLGLDVQQMPGTLADAGFKSGPGDRLMVNGRDAVESRNAGGPGGYEIYFVDAAGGLVYVNAAAEPGSTIPAAELARIGRTVARNVRFPGTAQVQPSFGVGYVPAGLQVRGFEVSASSGKVPNAGDDPAKATRYDIGALDRQASTVDVGIAVPPPAGAPGRPVQGHPTRYGDDRGYRTVSVLGAVDGHAVALSGKVSRAMLYRIADGLVLPG